MTSRRDAVRALAAIAALPFFRTLGAQELVVIGRRAHALVGLREAGSAAFAPRALTAAEFEMVTQAAERIIPRTGTPGATDARVAAFIDVMLADWYDDSERARFKAGLAELDARSLTMAGSAFTRITQSQQTRVLEAFDRDLAIRRQSGTPSADDDWFAMLKHLTVWGYYTSKVGIEDELRVQLIPGRYDGNAPY